LETSQKDSMELAKECQKAIQSIEDQTKVKVIPASEINLALKLILPPQTECRK
jgi:hypothetical protein